MNRRYLHSASPSPLGLPSEEDPSDSAREEDDPCCSFIFSSCAISNGSFGACGRCFFAGLYAPQKAHRNGEYSYSSCRAIPGNRFTRNVSNLWFRSVTVFPYHYAWGTLGRSSQNDCWAHRPPGSPPSFQGPPSGCGWWWDRVSAGRASIGAPFQWVVAWDQQIAIGRRNSACPEFVASYWHWTRSECWAASVAASASSVVELERTVVQGRFS